MTPALVLDSVSFGWPDQGALLSIDNLQIAAGERVFLQGESGSGKSTLLGLIAGIYPPQAGQVSLLGQDLNQLSGRGRDRFRAEHVGVIFQMFNLLPFLGVVENVLLGCQFSPRRRARLEGDGRAEAAELLGQLGLDTETIGRQQVGDLSVGQQQRVAAARALLGGPEVILADEPTSALDAGHRDQFLDVLLAQTARSGASLVFVSHDAALAGKFDTQLDLSRLNGATPDLAKRERGTV